ncbi:hypothetical protein PUN28_014273 [Cardiocondyla obscurior]|uniref:Protein prenyltransferase alpha subunit repeat-containing protein 1 n=1 Tax=Cardiocondyla obscurior TaxID=286306 RepID=A0AAW2EZA4_9HYME
MTDNEFPAAEKILGDIENTIRRNPTINSFVILPMEDSENRSPVFYQEDSLGLASWCVQPLYVYTYRRLLEYRRERHQRREEPSTVARWLLGALLLNPNVTTFWNMRRELVRAGRLDPRDELSLTRPVLYHTPKCFEAFSYRSWLMPHFLDVLDAAVKETIIKDELKLVQTCADRYANNYHAWSYRRYLVTMFEQLGQWQLTFKKEWNDTMDWCKRHVSDHSAYSYRQFLLRKFMLKVITSGKETDIIRICSPHYGTNHFMRKHNLDVHEEMLIKRINQAMYYECDDFTPDYARKLKIYMLALTFWTEECCFIVNYVCKYTDHEILWCHFRFLGHLLAVLTTAYAKHACYRYDDFWYAHCYDKSSLASLLPPQRPLDVSDDLFMAAHVMLIRTFCSTRLIDADPAVLTSYENGLLDKFCKYLERIGLSSELALYDFTTPR